MVVCGEKKNSRVGREERSRIKMCECSGKLEGGKRFIFA